MYPGAHFKLAQLVPLVLLPDLNTTDLLTVRVGAGLSIPPILTDVLSQDMNGKRSLCKR